MISELNAGEIYKSYEANCNQFKEGYTNKSLKNRIIIRIKSLWDSNTAYNTFKKAEKDAVENYASLYKGNILNLYTERKSVEKKSLKQSFIEKVIDVAQEKIRNEVSKGFIYEVKNEKDEVVGNLIGTIHLPGKANKNILLTESMKKAVENCKTLITELGDSWAAHLLLYSTIDFQVVRYAKKEKKNVEGFETVSEQYTTVQQMQQNKKINQGTQPTINELNLLLLDVGKDQEKYKLEDTGWVKKIKEGISSQEEILYLSAEKWKEGNEGYFKCVAENDRTSDAIHKQRNTKWLKGDEKKEGLIADLKKANLNSRICVAVGTAHLFCEHGLIHQLKLNGFTVTRIEE